MSRVREFPPPAPIEGTREALNTLCGFEPDKFVDDAAHSEKLFQLAQKRANAIDEVLDDASYGDSGTFASFTDRATAARAQAARRAPTRRG